MKLGVILPAGDLRVSARQAEDAGLDSVFLGDHLMTGRPSLDSTVGLGVAAAVTTRIRIGLSVFVPAMRPLAWAAKQIATLQEVSGERLILGIGSGGGEAQFAAAGVPYGERGPRTDQALRLLPDLLAGNEVRIGDAVVELAPAVAVPPIWVGNRGRLVLQRVAEHGTGWFPSLLPPDAVADGRRRLTDLGVANPVIAVGATGALGEGADLPTAADLATGINEAYGMSLDQALSLPLTGSAETVAERLAAYREAGAAHIVVGLAGPRWAEQVRALGRVRALLGP
ncbi:LLM class flavin-dependent oxidoreductase [Amycolatopsis roodepoortensis]|uniref:LLM class flavin-dependent oxidoreductase n=1 Tax=Amycolatopsis roodepoortensis TaxID=700274 RepID=UPI00214AB0D5|nr:LLM class flavin-dependent oxidoreductase [Amycolatopsis roodepoortensis]UUV32640.1 LLM class flavin-dependent oxidoreductase [Amycolatopsis roodepoortensis]